MKAIKYLIYFIIFFLNQTIYSQTEYSHAIYSDSTSFIIKGEVLDNDCYFDYQNEKIIINTYDKKNTQISKKEFKFSQLPEGYLYLYDNIILLNNDNYYYFQDLTSQKKSKYYNAVFNKYNDGILIGDYNPLLLRDNTLVVINKNLKEIFSKKLNNKWLLSSDSNTKTGFILLYKIDLTKKKHYFPYILNAKTGVIKAKH